MSVSVIRHENRRLEDVVDDHQAREHREAGTEPSRFGAHGAVLREGRLQHESRHDYRQKDRERSCDERLLDAADLRRLRRDVDDGEKRDHVSESRNESVREYFGSGAERVDAERDAYQVEQRCRVG